MLPALHPCVLYFLKRRRSVTHRLPNSLVVLWAALASFLILCVFQRQARYLNLATFTPAFTRSQNHKTKVFDRHMALPFPSLFTFDRHMDLRFPCLFTFDRHMDLHFPSLFTFDRHMDLPFPSLFTFERRKKLVAYLYPMLPDFQNSFAFLAGRFIILDF
jgi:hypothetical protein